ncbi:ATP-binding protein, partial [Paraburkholderia sp. BR14264]|uniref:ATP-binding protein n=1 Tax=Paraburkholderia sp. BR14264 TaxID=3237001 RepID=UPI00397B3E1A
SLEAVREAIVNALVHRDYSGLTLGAQVQVELHADRLVVRSPGGLYGPIAVEDLGEPGVSSSRNSTLVALLSDTFVPGSERLVVENRASGVPIMLRESRVLGQTRPEFESRIGSFTVTLSSSSLLSPDVLAWIEGLEVGPRSREKD